MMEIVHDLAPDANLYFATFGDEVTMAQNILDLALSGCTVIVDDRASVLESPFQDGPIARAVNVVTALGVTYFASGGNAGSAKYGTSSCWEGRL